MIRQQGFRIIATSTSERADLIVADDDGQPHAFIRSAGTISRRPLNSDFVDLLLESPNWRAVDIERRYSLDELRDAVEPE
jgi:hypothetical protein